jgi:NAD(P)-dependent dehydrogenase (short-subunit alcohol dehydrogenase family)
MMTDQAGRQGKTPEELLAETIRRQGIRRLGTPEDVAELVLFLCLPRSRHIQGTAISVDGGATKSLSPTSVWSWPTRGVTQEGMSTCST